MNRYDNYKDSSVQWIGKIPSHWEVKRMRFILSYQKGKNPNSLSFDCEDGMLPYLSMDYLRNSSDIIQYALPNENYTECVDGDILLLWDGSNAGEFIKSKSGILCSTCAKLSPIGVNSQFFWYYCKSSQSHLQDLTNGMGIPHVDADELRNMVFCVPTMEEQMAIAEYLDKKCDSIDKVIAAQEKRVEYLTELKNRIITDAVTKGINPDAAMKNSGVEWIGDIPNHWNVMPFKRCMRIYNGADYKHIESDIDNGYPVLGSGGVFAYALEYMYDGEALLLGRKGTIDRPLYINGKFWTVDTMYYSVPLKNAYCKYVYYQALNFPFKRYYTATALPSMTARDLNENPICLPPYQEQVQIVAYIEAKIAPIESAIAKAKREIELLKEFKQSIITDAVTGKIKVYNL
jgi:type I restriction enzyme S subunit